MRTSKPPQIWHGGSSNNHGRSHKEDGSVNIFIFKRGGASAVNALLIALITAVWIICVFGFLPLPLDLSSLGSSFLLLSLRLAAVGPI
jgi:hypothetical protein